MGETLVVSDGDGQNMGCPATPLALAARPQGPGAGVS